MREHRADPKSKQKAALARGLKTFRQALGQRPTVSTMSDWSQRSVPSRGKVPAEAVTVAQGLGLIAWEAEARRSQVQGPP